MPHTDSDSDSSDSDDSLEMGFPSNREEFLEKQSGGSDRFALPSSSNEVRESMTTTATAAPKAPALQRQKSSGDISTGSGKGGGRINRRQSMDSQGSFTKRPKMSRRSSLEDIGAQRSMRKLQRRPSLGALDQGIIMMQSDVNNPGAKKMDRRGSMSRQSSHKKIMEKRPSNGKKLSQLDRRLSGGASEGCTSTGPNQKTKFPRPRSSSALDVYAELLDKDSEEKAELRKRRHSEDVDLILSSSIMKLELEENLGEVSLGDALQKHYSSPSFDVNVDADADVEENKSAEQDKSETKQRKMSGSSLSSKSKKAGQVTEKEGYMLGWGASDCNSEISSEEEESLAVEEVVEAEEPAIYEDFPTFPVNKAKRDLWQESMITMTSNEEFDSRRPWRKAPKKEPPMQKRQSIAIDHLEKVINADIQESAKFDHTEEEKENRRDSLVDTQKVSLLGAGDTLPTADADDSDSDTAFDEILLAQAALDQALTLQSRIVHNRADDNSNNKYEENQHREPKLEEEETRSCDDDSFFNLPFESKGSLFSEKEKKKKEDDSSAKGIPVREIKTKPSTISVASPAMAVVGNTVDSNGISSSASDNNTAAKSGDSSKITGNDSSSTKNSKTDTGTTVSDTDCSGRQLSDTSSVRSINFEEAYTGRPSFNRGDTSTSEMSLISTTEIKIKEPDGASADTRKKLEEEQKSSRGLLQVVDEETEQDRLLHADLDEELGNLGTKTFSRREEWRKFKEMASGFSSINTVNSTTRRRRHATAGCRLLLLKNKRKVTLMSIVLACIAAASVVVFLQSGSGGTSSGSDNIPDDRSSTNASNVTPTDSNSSESLTNITSVSPSNFPTISPSLLQTELPSHLNLPSQQPTQPPLQVGVYTDTYFDGNTVPRVPTQEPAYLSMSPLTQPVTLSPMPSQVPSQLPTLSVNPTASNYPSSRSPALSVNPTASNYPPSQSPTTEMFELIQIIDGPQELDFAGKSVSISSDGTYLAIGFQMANEIAARSGAVRVYEKGLDGYMQFGDVIIGIEAGDEFGYAVSISDNGQRVAVGARFSNDNGDRSGHVRVFEYNETSSSWDQMGGTIEGNKADDRTGSSVSISGDGHRLAVGSIRAGNNVGSVRVFEYDNVSWTPFGQEIFGETEQGEAGNAVSMSQDGNTVAIGFVRSDVDGFASGRVSVYHYYDSEGSGSWDIIGQHINGEAADDLTGQSVSLSSNGLRVAIGANGRDGPDGTRNIGYCRVFGLIDNLWTPIGSAILGEAEEEQIGYSVSLSKDGLRVACGGPNSSFRGPRSGVVKIYEESNGDWEQIGKTLSSFPGSAFGESISLSAKGNYLAVGAPEGDKESMEDVGFVGLYLYQ